MDTNETPIEKVSISWAPKIAMVICIGGIIITGFAWDGLGAARALGVRLGRPPAMTAEQIRHARDLLARPDNTVSSIARLLGVSRSTIYKYGDSGRLRVLSTEGIVRRARESDAREFVIATENGIIHRLEKEVSGKNFYPASPGAICRYMKMITLDNLHQSLQEDVYEVTVPADIADRARLAVERMVAIV